jgi:maleylpyruvate isomerase
VTDEQRTREDSLRWMAEGTTLFLGALERLPDTRLNEPCALAGWSGRHVLAHVALNAVALTNLVTWARTGVETPMYSSPHQRDTDIEAHAELSAAELKDRVVETAVALDAALAGLTEQQWHHEVRTRQGRAVPGEEIPWMRAREVMVHAIDLAAGLGFDDLPPDFLASLIDDIVAKRSAEELGLVLVATDHPGRWHLNGPGTTEVEGTLAGLTAYLAGRETDVAGPDLPAWL